MLAGALEEGSLLLMAKRRAGQKPGLAANPCHIKLMQFPCK